MGLLNKFILAGVLRLQSLNHSHYFCFLKEAVFIGVVQIKKVIDSPSELLILGLAAKVASIVTFPHFSVHVAGSLVL